MSPLLTVACVRGWAPAVAVWIAIGVSWTACTETGRADSQKAVVRITGSDTMINLLQAWAEHYRAVRPAVSVQVAGGGSGVGFAGLLDGTLDIAAASREIRPDERWKTKLRTGADPREFVVALDALAVYVNWQTPVLTISIDELAEIFGEHGVITTWSRLGVRHRACASDEIIRVGRQNNSGTFSYFRDVVLGPHREYKLGSIDQNGSKDVVALISKTPCAIGYSGLAFAVDQVKTLTISRRRGALTVAPTTATALDGSYPFARPLYLYTSAVPARAVNAFLEWVLSTEGQAIVRELRFVPAQPAMGRTRPTGG